MTAEAKTREFIKLVNDGAMSQAACAAAELGIADLLASGPKRADELARVCRTVVANALSGARPAAVRPLRPVDRAETPLRRVGARA